jgi:hypothetical protein
MAATRIAFRPILVLSRLLTVPEDGKTQLASEWRNKMAGHVSLLLKEKSVTSFNKVEGYKSA